MSNCQSKILHAYQIFNLFGSISQTKTHLLPYVNSTLEVLG